MYETDARALGYGRVKRRRKCGPCARGNQQLAPLVTTHLTAVPEALTLSLQLLHRRGELEKGLALFEK